MGVDFRKWLKKREKEMKPQKEVTEKEDGGKMVKLGLTEKSLIKTIFGGDR